MGRFPTYIDPARALADYLAKSLGDSWVVGLVWPDLEETPPPRWVVIRLDGTGDISVATREVTFGISVGSTPENCMADGEKVADALRRVFLDFDTPFAEVVALRGPYPVKDDTHKTLAYLTCDMVQATSRGT